MEIRVLGALEVRDGGMRVGPRGLGGRKPKQVLQILAASRGHPVAKERLVDLLWDGFPPCSPMTALENHVWVLRCHLRRIAADRRSAVVAEVGAYRLACERVTLDLDHFDLLVRDARRRGLAEGRRQLEKALALVRGEVLEDEPHAPSAAGLRDRYRRRVRDVLLEAAEAALLGGEPRTAVTHATRALERDPRSERARRLRTVGLAEQDQRAQTARVLEADRSRTAPEAGAEPAAGAAASGSGVRDDAVGDLPVPAGMVT